VSSLPSYHIRQSRSADAAPLLELFQDTIRRVNCRDYGPDQIAAWTSGILPEVWAARLAARWCVVAEMNDSKRLGGFADLEADGHLDRFYVSADFQRIGIGRALLAAVLQRAAELQLPRIFSEVSITARPFFLSQGFREITDQLVFSRGAAFLNYRMEYVRESFHDSHR
jgi:putative acetyltransferase